MGVATSVEISPEEVKLSEARIIEIEKKRKQRSEWILQPCNMADALEV
jgi:hypothetical protein